MKNNVVRKKLGIRFISVITAMTLVAGSLAGCKSDSKDNAAKIKNDTKTEILQNIMEKQVGLARSTNGEPSKDEVVYVLADANGNKNEVIVSDWLKNTKAETTISDVTNLTNITNVSGDEAFTVDENNNITWNADGNDIHYQGNSNAELPVDVKVTYYLDGNEIAPDELAGKSGKVTIRFDYNNHASRNVEIGGEERQIYVPFTMMSGAILDNSHFANIEVTNGRVVSTGNTNIVMGMAFPGLADSLDIASLKEKIDDKEKAEEIDESKIPDYVEITADTVDFKMDQTMTMAFSDVMSSLNLDSQLDLDTQELTDSMDELEDASVKLANGSSDLNSGAGELSDGAKTLAEKSLDLFDGAHKLNDGAADLVSGASQLNDGAGSLLDGICKVDGGASTLNDGANKLDTGVGTLKAGADQLAAGTAKLSASAPQLAQGAEQLASGLSTAQESISQLYLLAETAYYKPENGTYLHPDAVAAAMGGITGSQSSLSVQTANEAESLESSVNAIAASLSEDLAEYSGLAAEYESQMNACSSRIAADREAINQIVNSPSYEDIQVVTGSSDVTNEYTYTTAIYNTVNTTTNNYYSSGSVDEEGNESGDVLTGQSSDTQQDSSEETGTGTYTYTQYEIGTTQVASYDMGALMGAVDALVADCDELSSVKASYYAYSEIANYLNGYCSSLNAICSDARTLTQTASLSEESSALADAQVKEVSMQLQEDAAKQNAATFKLTEGLHALNTSMRNTLPKVNQLAAGAQQASAGAAELNAGAKKLAGGADELKAGTASLVMGTGTLKDGTTKLASGAGELRDGTARLSEGTVTLKNGTTDLEDGAAQFVDGTQALYDGTLTLNDGTRELMDGMIKFKDEGIDKLTEIFGDDVQDVVDTLNVVMDAGKEYNIFSGASSDVESSVKFIYKTDAIK